jgi:hypothetical protein
MYEYHGTVGRMSLRFLIRSVRDWPTVGSNCDASGLYGGVLGSNLGKGTDYLD